MKMAKKHKSCIVSENDDDHYGMNQRRNAEKSLRAQD